MLKRKATAATKKTITKKPKPAENGSESGLLKTMPESYDFPGISDNCIKIISYNVSGIRSSVKKGLSEYLAAESATIAILQETKLNNGNEVNMISKTLYPYQYWNHSTVKKGYSGTALLSKVEPLNVTYGCNGENDEEGRTITAEFKNFYLISSYMPNAGEKLKRLEIKQAANSAMEKWMKELKNRGKPVIWAGDLNVAHTEIDLFNPKGNVKNAGYTPEERADFTRILETGYLDIFRHLNPDVTKAYTYYGYRANCRAKGNGWRLDYFVLDRELVDKVVETGIRDDCYGASDHVPIFLILKGLNDH